VAVTREAQHILNRRASALAALAKHPSWPERAEEVGRKIERLRKTAVTVALADGGADQRKLDMIRGTIGALNWLVGVPKRSEHSLEEYLREQGLEVPDE
jgi:hypothetical protein